MTFTVTYRGAKLTVEFPKLTLEFLKLTLEFFKLTLEFSESTLEFLLLRHSLAVMQPRPPSHRSVSLS